MFPSSFIFFPDSLYFFHRHKRKLKAIVAGSTGEQGLGFSSHMRQQGA